MNEGRKRVCYFPRGAEITEAGCGVQAHAGLGSVSGGRAEAGWMNVWHSRGLLLILYAEVAEILENAAGKRVTRTSTRGGRTTVRTS